MDQIQKAIEANQLSRQDNIDTMTKGRSLPVGTVKKRGQNEFIKTADGKWKYKGRVTNKHKESEKVNGGVDPTTHSGINDYLAKFPNDAASWGQATDEIREITATVREAYNELTLNVVEGDKGYVESLNFREFKKPAEWNTNAKKQIKTLWSKLNDQSKEHVISTMKERKWI